MGSTYAAGVEVAADGSLSHLGGWAGFVTIFGITADRSTAIAVMCNSTDANAGAVAEGLRALWRGVFRDWNGRNLAALNAAAGILRDDHRATLDRFEALRGTRGPRALSALAVSGLTRQTLAGSLALWIAAVTGRL